jgi:hypothetical protein
LHKRRYTHRHFINGVEVGPRYCDNLDDVIAADAVLEARGSWPSLARPATEGVRVAWNWVNAARSAGLDERLDARSHARGHRR